MLHYPTAVTELSARKTLVLRTNRPQKASITLRRTLSRGLTAGWTKNGTPRPTAEMARAGARLGLASILFAAVAAQDTNSCERDPLTRDPAAQWLAPSGPIPTELAC